MFRNRRDITVNDIVMFHENVRGRVWIGLTVGDSTVDKDSLYVRWYWPDDRTWTREQSIPKSLLYLLGPIPENTELDL